MKKTYISPFTDVVKVIQTHFIAASEKVGLNDSLSDADQGLVDNSDRIKGHLTLWDNVW